MPLDFAKSLPTAALSFRGYNNTNLGRTPELLAHPRYGPIVAEYLEQGSEICANTVGRHVDLTSQVAKGEEFTLEQYAEAVSFIVAVEQAQLEILWREYQIDYKKARVSFGYSLGEIAALVAGGILDLEAALRVPLTMAKDCVDLAEGVTLGVLFSRRDQLVLPDIQRLCVKINSEGRGVIGISAYLAPNSLLLMGQGDTLDRFRKRMKTECAGKLYLRKNENQWPPMHTPIVWQRSISDRSAQLMHTLPGGFGGPTPPVLSLVTGKLSYNDFNAREILHMWIDHPQRLWDAVLEILAMGITTLVHVGPAPNIIPATFERLALDVQTQTEGRFHMHALSSIVNRPWLKSLLPARAVLLRAPKIKHVTLEDWLLEQGA